MPITKRPCANCPFRCDGSAIELHPGRVQGIVKGLLDDDHKTFLCHKTLDKDPMTCAGAVGLMSKVGRLPFIARLGLEFGVITADDVAASAAMVIDPAELAPLRTCAHDEPTKATRRRGSTPAGRLDAHVVASKPDDAW